MAVAAWYPPLPSCPGAQTPCAQEAVNDALTSLRNLLFGDCPNCVTYVFSTPQIADAGIDQRIFYRYLMRVPGLYNGTRSYAPMELLCAACGYTGTVRDFMSRNGSDVITQTPSEHGTGILTYFNPSAVNPSVGTTAPAKENQAMLFHEGLHGATGLLDGSPFTGGGLKGTFGISSAQSSFAITEFLGYFIFAVGTAPTYDPTQTNCSGWPANWP